MDAQANIKIKLFVLAALAAVIATLLFIYVNSSPDATFAEQRKSRWQALQALPIPPNAAVLDERTEGNIHPYGIDAHKVILLETTGMAQSDSQTAIRNALSDFYAKTIIAWHPGMLRQGQADNFTTVQGPAGLATIEVTHFWYGDILNRKKKTPVDRFIMKRYKPKDGLGRRFARVRVFICTR